MLVWCYVWIKSSLFFYMLVFILGLPRGRALPNALDVGSIPGGRAEGERALGGKGCYVQNLNVGIQVHLGFNEHGL